MKASIASAEPDDLDGITTVVSEMAAHYGSANVSPIRSPDVLRNILFEDNLGTHVLVARSESTVVGLASYAFIWPAFGRRAIYLKDLYVLESHRNQGIGTQLFEGVKEEGRRHDCARIDWLVDDDNVEALRFYERGGHESHKAGFRLPL